MEHGTQVRLSASLVSEGTSNKMLYVLHGIFGSGRNWSSVIRRLVRSRPAWAARLIDLRQHGSSKGFTQPHTLSAAARDIMYLAEANGDSPAAILGHSFGGKVALTYARAHGAALDQVWVVDSTPEARVPDGTAWQMLQLLRGMPPEFVNRDQLIQLLAAKGIQLPVAQWMATNLEQGENGRYRWRFDLDAIEELLRDFFEQDLWSVLEQPPGHAQIHIVKARASSILSPAAVERVRGLSQNGRVFYHEIDSGHWVNADNPEALLALMTRHL
ncbi:MAG: alpha/beta fold hydrolase [Gemmatimonadota bacterium]